jgi:hypothetical protein
LTQAICSFRIVALKTIRSSLHQPYRHDRGDNVALTHFFQFVRERIDVDLCLRRVGLDEHGRDDKDVVGVIGHGSAHLDDRARRQLHRPCCGVRSIINGLQSAIPPTAARKRT